MKNDKSFTFIFEFAVVRVLMLGDTATGKSSLVSQFMTSEYLHAYDTSIGEYLNLLLLFIFYSKFKCSTNGTS